MIVRFDDAPSHAHYSVDSGLNQRFHRLWPTNETFITEIERTLINVGMAGQTPGGVRYFARLHGEKDPPTVRAYILPFVSSRSV